MNILLIKLDASGDVVRTTPLLRRLSGGVTWVTSKLNIELLAHGNIGIRAIEWSDRERALDRHYDLVINLEDDVEAAAFGAKGQHTRLFGAYLNKNGCVAYSEDAHDWFDLSLTSVYGRQRADELKLQNRRTYQELVFRGLGLTFAGERYVLPPPISTPLCGDVAIAPVAGPVWPMKGWAYFDLLKCELEAMGLRVNVLPRRQTLLEHVGDVQNHRCLVSGDSLPMHLAIGTQTPCVTLFNCTSPWEIYGYGVQTKVVSPMLERFFYKRGFDSAATTAIRLDVVYDAVMQTLRRPVAVVR